MKKTKGQKSRETVPLRMIFHLLHFLFTTLIYVVNEELSGDKKYSALLEK
jgi:hypothetical protein